jgi:gliding motility-associated-like protein
MNQFLRRLSLLVLVWVGYGEAGAADGLRFIQNKGQWQQDVLFRAELPGGFLFLKKQSMVYVLYDAREVSAQHASKPLQEESSRVVPQVIKAHGVEVQFAGSSPEVKLSQSSPDGSSYNYFIGNDSNRWGSQAGGFGEVLYKDLYPGIDFRIYAYKFTIKYEFIVHPGADASRIRLNYEGAAGLQLNKSGQVVIETSVGPFKEAKPYSFQEIEQRTREIASNFVLKDNQIEFALPNDYDHTQSLTIDPELIFSTFSGAQSDNWGHTATYDNQGNLYSGGTVFGANFPVSIGAFQVNFGGFVDTALMKFSPDGARLLYATFVGGSATDIPNSLVTNSKGELFVYGTTASTNFATTGNAFQTTFGGGASITPIDGLGLANGSDIFVLRISPNGQQLLGSTYLGGSGNDGLSSVSNIQIRNYGDTFRGEIVLDKNENVLIVSSTNSTNFPLKNAFQTTLSGRQDAVISRFSSDLSTLQWSTYFGGGDFDAAFSIKPSTNGEDVYITGLTKSNNLPIKGGTFKDRLGGAEDAYVARFKNDQFVQVSYLGTDAADGAYLLDLDPSGNVHVFGVTRGAYPVSQGVYSDANSGQFIHALDPTLSRTIFSTVIGSKRGVPDISPTALLVNECGNIYIAGWGGTVNERTTYNTQSSTNGMTVTDDAIRRTTNGNNFYLAILEAGAKSMLYATYFGSVSPANPLEDRGDHVDGGTSRFDKNGVVYHATCACGGTRFPTSPTAWSRTNNSDNCNNAAFKLDIDRLRADFDVYDGTVKGVVQGCAPLNLTFVNTSEGGVDYIWEIDGGGFSREANQSNYNFTKAGNYTVTLQAFNRLTCKKVDIATKQIKVTNLNVVAAGDTTVCHGVPVPLLVQGGKEHTWSPTEGLDNPKSTNPIARIDKTTEYKVEVKDEAGCVVTKTVKVTVDDSKPDFLASKDTTICPGQTVVLTSAGSAVSYIWTADPSLSDTTGTRVSATPTQTTTYTVKGQYDDGCTPTETMTITVDNNKPDFTVSPGLLVCAGQKVDMQAFGSAAQFIWKGDSSLNATIGTVITAFPSQTTTYTVQAKYADGCKPEKQIIVQVDRTYEPLFEIIQSGEACNEPVKYEFQNLTKNAARYEWNVGNGARLTSNNVSDKVYDTPGEYAVTLTAYNQAGCALSVSRLLSAAPPLVLPNVITPNGDGKNDTFVVPVQNSSLQIYNRWGKEVLNSPDYQNNWGKGVGNGTYFYEIATRRGNRCKGWVQVLE